MLPTDMDHTAYDEQHVLWNHRPSLVTRSGRQVEANPLDEKIFSVVRAFTSAIVYQMKQTLNVENKKNHNHIKE